jgi:transposase
MVPLEALRQPIIETREPRFKSRAAARNKERLGRASTMGQRTLRRPLTIGANAVASRAARNRAPAGSSLDRLMSRKPPMLVRVALANKMARIVWALLTKGGVYRVPVATA